jgi:CSLREA domain-containing protein
MITRKFFAHKFPVFLNALMILSVLAGGFGLPSSTHALGLAIEVNTTADNTIKDGLCSLREAINNANRNWQFHGDCGAGHSDDGIFFSNTLGMATITLTSALPIIRDSAGYSLTIDGGGDITINGNNLFQVFQIHSVGILTLDRLTVWNGNSALLGVGGGAWNIGTLTVQNSTFYKNQAESGAGIYNARTGRLTIINSNFFENSANTDGGGLFNEGGSVTIQSSSFSENSAGEQGGGLYTTIVNGFPVNVLTITASSFESNQAGQMGGGIYSQLAGTLDILDSAFSGNSSSESGGGIYNDAGGSLNLSHTQFADNASSYGGAIFNLGVFHLDGGTFKENSAWYGGGMYSDHATASTIDGVAFMQNVADFGAGIYNIKGDQLTITSSSFAGNIGDGIYNIDGTILVMKSEFSSNGNGIFSHANQGPFDFAILRVWDSSFSKNRGSGIYNDFAGTNVFTSTFTGNGNSGVRNINYSVVTVDRSTLYGNVAESGGGIYNENSDLHIRNSTLTENKASYGGGLYNTGIVEVINATFADNTAKGNNIFNIHPATQPVTDPTKLYLYNTILTNPTAADDCQDHNAMVDGNNNLTRSDSANACGLVNGMNGNLIGFDPDLGTLIGSPAYYPLNIGSLAIDAGDDVMCGMLGNESQNGVTRPQGAHCDIGSYELPFGK